MNESETAVITFRNTFTFGCNQTGMNKTGSYTPAMALSKHNCWNENVLVQMCKVHFILHVDAHRSK